MMFMGYSNRDESKERKKKRLFLLTDQHISTKTASYEPLGERLLLKARGKEEKKYQRRNVKEKISITQKRRI
jgi:hypothetical protein